MVEQTEFGLMRVRLPNFSDVLSAPMEIAGPLLFATMPSVTLAAYWLWGPRALVAAAILGPVFCALGFTGRRHKLSNPRPEALEEAISHNLWVAQRGLRRTACLLIEIDDAETLMDRFGLRAFEQIGETATDRIRSALRDEDTVVSLSHGQFGIAIAPMRKLDSNVCVQIAGRIQQAFESPIAIDASKIYVTVSVGICLRSALSRGSGRDVSDAASLALLDARRYAPSGIRVYSPALTDYLAPQSEKDIDAVRGLKAGEILAWFQPQISTDTGDVSGFEALARWSHPARGLILPGEFLPALRDQGQIGQLGQKVLHDALTAMQKWDRQSLDIPQIGINCSPEELRDPKLVDRIAWELDRFGIAPDRLVIEVLETVVAYSSDDTVARNLRRLVDLGCRIDLDDFGTGHTSISSIRRFGVHRLKIDRSFVQKVNKDCDQQRIVNAIQLMADQMGLTTIAEGVETAGEHEILAQLGCQHVQGFGIAKPMPFEQTLPWIASHRSTLAALPKTDRSAG